MTRVALYARYSCDNQHNASFEDQLRQGRDYAGRQGWSVVESHPTLTRVSEPLQAEA